MNTLENRLKKARENAGLSQRKLADKLGVAYRTIQRYETDANALTIKMASEIASACNIELKWLLSGETSTESTPSTLLHRHAQDLSTEDLDEIKHFIEFKLAKKLKR